MNADLHNLDDTPTPYWQLPIEFESLYDELSDSDEIALELADAELDQIERWIDVAEQHGAEQSDQTGGV